MRELTRNHKQLLRLSACIMTHLARNSAIPRFTMYSRLSASSRGCRPDEETLLANVEVDVAADLVGHVSTEVTANDAMPHALVLLLE